MGFTGEILWNFLEKPYQRVSEKEARKVNAIVVLSGSRHPAPGKSEIVEWLDPDRFLAGISLFKAGKAPYLIFTGGANPLKPEMPPEGYYFKKEAISLGIPKKSILTTKAVFNTYQEALAVKEIISTSNQFNNQKILLVTSAFHMKRAKKVFEREGLIVTEFPVDFQANGKWAGNVAKNPLFWLPTAEGLLSSSRAFREIIGRTIYRSW